MQKPKLGLPVNYFLYSKGRAAFLNSPLQLWMSLKQNISHVSNLDISEKKPKIKSLFHLADCPKNSLNFLYGENVDLRFICLLFVHNKL
jgi:hypothetical protein